MAPAPPSRTTPPKQNDTCSFLLRLDPQSGRLTILPSHKAWLRCGEMKQDQSTQKFGDSNTYHRSRAARRCRKPFAISRISDRHAWLAGFCRLPDFSGAAADLAALLGEF